MEEKIKKELEDLGYDYAVSIDTDAEVEIRVACGQLSMIIEESINQLGGDLLSIRFFRLTNQQ